MPMELQVDTEMLEYYCDNNASRERISKTSAGQAVDVPAATLARYVGVYDVVDDNGRTLVAAVTLANTSLLLDYGGKGNEELVPLTPSRFSWSGAIVEFSTAADGAARIVFHYAEGSEGGPRRR
jgi:hypothetical protein